MYRIILIVLMMAVSHSIYAKNIEVKVGVPELIKFQKDKQVAKGINFLFYKDDYNFRLMNKLISKEMDIAILPAEYSLQAVGSVEEIEILGRIGSHKIYLMVPSGFGAITKKKLAGKTFLIRSNSADEFYLKKFMGEIAYKSIYANITEITKAVANGFKINQEIGNIVVLNAEAFAKLKNKTKLMSLAIPGGFYYILALMQNNWIVKNDENRKAFGKNRIKYQDLSKGDAAELLELSKSLVKKETAEQFFETFYNDSLKDI